MPSDSVSPDISQSVLGHQCDSGELIPMLSAYLARMFSKANLQPSIPTWRPFIVRHLCITIVKDRCTAADRSSNGITAGSVRALQWHNSKITYKTRKYDVIVRWTVRVVSGGHNDIVSCLLFFCPRLIYNRLWDIRVIVKDRHTTVPVKTRYLLVRCRSFGL